MSFLDVPQGEPRTEYKKLESWGSSPVNMTFLFLAIILFFVVLAWRREDWGGITLILVSVMYGHTMIRRMDQIYLKSPDLIRLKPEGIELIHANESIVHRWGELGLVIDYSTWFYRSNRLALFDRQGKLLETLTVSYDCYEDLVSRITTRVELHADENQFLLGRYLRRSGAWQFSFALLAMFLSWALFSYESKLADTRFALARQLRESGLETEAEIIKPFRNIATTTYELSYRFRTLAGEEIIREVSVEKEHSQDFLNLQTIPVRYLELQPEINELVHGESKLDKPYVEKYIWSEIAMLLVAFGLMCLIQGGFHFIHGYMLRFDVSSPELQNT